MSGADTVSPARLRLVEQAQRIVHAACRQLLNLHFSWTQCGKALHKIGCFRSRMFTGLVPDWGVVDLLANLDAH